MRRLDHPAENRGSCERAPRQSLIRLKAALERRKEEPEQVQMGGRERAMRLIEKRLSCTNLRELLQLIPECFEGIRRIDITIQGASDSAIQRRMSASVAVHPDFGEYIVFDSPAEAADVNIIRKILTVERSSGVRRIGAIDVSSLSEPTLKLRGSDSPEEAADVFRSITALIARTIDASLDGLTLLSTRKSIDDTLLKCGSEFVNKGRQFSAIMLDIDHFKDVNDSHGHGAGDFVIANVASILLNGTRGIGSVSIDSVGRYGGEEFLILMQDVRLEVATMVAERLRKEIRKHGFAAGGPDRIHVTCSFGVADSTELERGLSAESAGTGLVGLADSRLYSAKRNGRDQVEPHPLGSLRLAVNE